MPEYEQRPQLCPYCGDFIEAASSAPGQPRGRPSPNDISICINCGGLLLFDKTRKLVPFPPDRLHELTYAQRRIVTLSQEFIRRRGPILRKEKKN